MGGVRCRRQSVRRCGRGSRCCLGAMPAPEPFADTGHGIEGPVAAVRWRWVGLRNELDRPSTGMVRMSRGVASRSSALTLAWAGASRATQLPAAQKEAGASLSDSEAGQGPPPPGLTARGGPLVVCEVAAPESAA
jgi:hypothetical protein